MLDPIVVWVHAWATDRPDLAIRAMRGDRGQTTAEYALVLLGAATVALLLIAWAVKTGKITTLLNTVLDKILDQI
jgi:hypothetical protein